MSDFVNSQSVSRRHLISRGVRVSYQFVSLLAAAIDCLSVLLSGVISWSLYQYFFQNGAEKLDLALGVGGIGGAVFCFLANYFKLYRLPSLLQPVRMLQRTIAAIFLACVIVTFILYVFHASAEIPRASVATFLVLTTISLTFLRFFYGSILDSLLASGALIGRRAILIGEESELRRLTPANLLVWFGCEEVARVSIPTAAHADADQRMEERVDFAIRLARKRAGEEVIVAISWNRVELLQKVNSALRVSSLPVRLLADRAVSAMMGDRHASADAPMVSIELQRAPLSIAEQKMKRALDIVLAGFALMLLWPLMLAAAVAIRLDTSGPILFWQKRTGFDGGSFKICKFRTMTVLEDGAKIVQARPGDRRVTRVGAFLRRSSIDELPQLFNVLRGDMSLVGPRPHAVAHDEQYLQQISKYAFRFHVKPGITGWAQVNGQRGETARLEEMEKRIESDLWYIKNWSFGLDLWILLRTAFEVTRHKAY